MFSEAAWKFSGTKSNESESCQWYADEVIATQQ
jgi:hypothetical protein